LDLSAATDRFPISLQVKLIRNIFNHDVAINWYNILINRVYTYLPPKGSKDEPKHLKYAVGQPMGAYSSWATFTLSHHLVVA